MKKVIALVVAFLLFSLPCLALEVSIGNVTLNYSEEITVCTKENIPSENGMIFGMSQSDFKEYLISNGILIYGLNNDNLFAFELTGEKTEFTNSIGDFSVLSNEDIKDFAQKTVGNNYNIEKHGENSYIVLETIGQKDNRDYTLRQYITVNNQTLYVVTFTMGGKGVTNLVDQSIQKVLNGISFFKKVPPKQVNIFTVIIIAVLTIVVLAFAVYLTVTLIKEIINKKANQKEQDEE